jgi:hypothetical protein
MRAHFDQARAAREEEQRLARKARLVANRGDRMSCRLDRRRAAIRAKWWARGRVALAFLIGVPVVVILVSLAWRAAAWAALS